MRLNWERKDVSGQGLWHYKGKQYPFIHHQPDELRRQ